MIDTMTATKVVGALCGSLLVFLLGGWAAESLYHVGGHGEDHEQAYAIEVPEGGGRQGGRRRGGLRRRLRRGRSGRGRVDSGASARPATSWRRARTAPVPTLYGVVGREQAAVSDYAYSAAFAELAAAWTPEELDGFLHNPSEWVPGTKMTYRGLADVQDRADIIAYLEGFGS